MKNKITQVIPAGLSSAIFPFITDYYANAQYYDRALWRHYGEKELYEGEYTAEQWGAEVTAVLYLYKEELQHLYEINVAEYSPVDNVFEETITTHETDAHEDKVNYGSQSNSQTIGSRTDTQNAGTNGKTGNSTTTTTRHEVPYDSNTQRTVGSETAGVVNSELETTLTSGQQVNNESVGAKEDKTNYGKQHEETTINRHGNIGVTLSTDIMKGSRDFWAMFNFMNEVFYRINKELFTGVW